MTDIDKQTLRKSVAEGGTTTSLHNDLDKLAREVAQAIRSAL